MEERNPGVICEDALSASDKNGLQLRAAKAAGNCDKARVQSLLQRVRRNLSSTRRASMASAPLPRSVDIQAAAPTPFTWHHHDESITAPRSGNRVFFLRQWTLKVD